MNTINQFNIDDEINDSLQDTVDVTMTMLNGKKRWCFFITPNQLAKNGDWVDGTKVRYHLGVKNMIIVSELSKEIIARIINELDMKGEIEAVTIVLEDE